MATTMKHHCVDPYCNCEDERRAAKRRPKLPPEDASVPLYSLTADKTQVHIRRVGPQEQAVRVRVLRRIEAERGEENTSHQIRAECNGMTPYLKHLPPARRAFWFGGDAGVMRLRDCLAAHPEFHEDFEKAMEKALAAGAKGFLESKAQPRDDTDILSQQCDAIREIGRQFGIVLPKYVM